MAQRNWKIDRGQRYGTINTEPKHPNGDAFGNPYNRPRDTVLGQHQLECCANQEVREHIAPILRR